MATEPLKGPRIVVAAYDLVLELYPTVRSFPKSQQYLLGRRIEETALEILLGLVAANTVRNKLSRLPDVDQEVEKLRFLVRLSADLKFISARRYAALAERVDEIGRMLGGWIKSESAKDPSQRGRASEREKRKTEGETAGEQQ